MLCAEWDEPKTKEASQKALKLLMTHVEDVLALGKVLAKNDHDSSNEGGSQSDVVVERWCASCLFQATLDDDESHDHVLQSIESAHPYRKLGEGQG